MLLSPSYLILPAQSMRRFLPLVFIAGTALLTSCAKDTEPVPAPLYLLDQRWVLAEIEGKAAGEQTGSTSTDLILSSVGSSNSGRAFCNQYGGQYQLAAASAGLRFSNQHATYATCSNQDLETRYLQLLPQVTRYSISNRQLALYDTEHAQPLLVFKAAK
ncbi:META domain-containing protein [Hymenobacter sediminis]|uniref:META domain-containing protein n=1 Tax=Hymenobacter sediminis TaxID=2218621 RepID=UPI001390353D|nr:META domain-containing protein [Hymenobacter sediminis]